jgi:glycogen debranching enzyme
VLRLFWSDARGFLADAWSPARGADLRLRARQVRAVALPHTLVPRDKAEPLLRALGRELLTPVGLRTLAPSEAGYLGHDDPASCEDDGRGGAWPALACAYFDALVRVEGEDGKRAGRAWLHAFERHLGEAGLGYASPSFDGDAPHTPRGPIAHAVTVGELLRLAVRLGPSRQKTAG